MSIIFAGTYGLRAVYLAGASYYHLFIHSKFAMQIIRNMLYCVWDIPAILSILLLNLKFARSIK